jgi:uncharacterized protein (DUF2147 family)
MQRILAVALLALAATPALAAPGPVTGRWTTAEGKAQVVIGMCGANLCGKIDRILKPTPGRATTDINNPNAALRAKPLAGLMILTGFTASGDIWKGKIYDPESGKTYRSELSRSGDTLNVKGCLFGPLCRTQVWTRVN